MTGAVLWLSIEDLIPMANRIPPSNRVPRGNLRAFLEEDAEASASIRNADVIFGVDVHNSGEKLLFFGKATLEQIVRTGDGRKALIVNVPVDFDTDDVECLVAACMQVKGSCGYNGEEIVDPSVD